jgi:hypothetical protein
MPGVSTSTHPRGAVTEIDCARRGLSWVTHSFGVHSVFVRHKVIAICKVPILPTIASMEDAKIQTFIDRPSLSNLWHTIRSIFFRRTSSVIQSSPYIRFSGGLFASYWFSTHLPPMFPNSCPENIETSLRKVKTLAPRYILPNHYSGVDGKLHRGDLIPWLLN